MQKNIDRIYTALKILEGHQQGVYTLPEDEIEEYRNIANFPLKNSPYYDALVRSKEGSGGNRS